MTGVLNDDEAKAVAALALERLAYKLSKDGITSNASENSVTSVTKCELYGICGYLVEADVEYSGGACVSADTLNISDYLTA